MTYLFFVPLLKMGINVLFRAATKSSLIMLTAGFVGVPENQRKTH